MNVTITSTPFTGGNLLFITGKLFSNRYGAISVQCSLAANVPSEEAAYLFTSRSTDPCFPALRRRIWTTNNVYTSMKTRNRLFVDDLYLLISGKNRDPVVGNCYQGGDCYNGKSHLLSQFFFANVLSDYLSARLIPVRNSMGVTPNFFRKSRWNVCTVDMPHDLAIASIV